MAAVVAIGCMIAYASGAYFITRDSGDEAGFTFAIYGGIVVFIIMVVMAEVA